MLSNFRAFIAVLLVLLAGYSPLALSSSNAPLSEDSPCTLEGCCRWFPEHFCLADSPSEDSAPTSEDDASKRAPYCLIEKAGEGAYGAVFIAQDAQNHRVAVKVQDWRHLSASCLEKLRQGNLILLSYAANPHPNIVRPLAYFQQPHDNASSSAPLATALVMEYCDAGDLQKHIRYFREKNSVCKEGTAGLFFVQIVLGVHVLHQAGTLHRDLKPANILLTCTSIAKIADFDFACPASGGISDLCGTPNFMAPEVWRKMPPTKKSDIWSLGIVFYRYLTLNYPFINTETGNHQEILTSLRKNICRSTYPSPDLFREQEDALSPEMHQLISIMLNKDPQDRPSTDEILRLPLMRYFAADLLTILQGEPNAATEYATLITALTKIFTEYGQSTGEPLPKNQLLIASPLELFDETHKCWVGEFVHLDLDRETQEFSLISGGNHDGVKYTHRKALTPFLGAFAVTTHFAHQNNPCVFSLVSAEGREITYRAATPELRDHWVDSLEKACSYSRGP
jgi:serine/threonine protein kinase